MIWLSILASIIFGALAVVHTAWAFEVWWPIRDERRLVASVVGFKAAERMPGAIPCASVATGALAIIALLWMPEGWVRTTGLSVAAAFLIIRGVLAYVPKWRRMTPQQPFARNDRLFYGPLCVVLGLILTVSL